MAALFFDFDSTLVPCESLEELCKRARGLSAEDLRELEALTSAGMEGAISFEDSLRRRLELARPSLEETLALGRELAVGLTSGARDLVARLRVEGHEVWIVSGGFREILLETGRSLGLPEAAVHGVQCRWGPSGALLDLDPANGFLLSKVEGLGRLGRLPTRPRVGVGDGATDLALRTAGLVDTFVAYTEFARRPSVVRGADFEAANMEALGEILGTLCQ